MKIINNYFEGTGENILFGGADPRIDGLVPSDIEIRRNHFTKPTSWKSRSWPRRRRPAQRLPGPDSSVADRTISRIVAVLEVAWRHRGVRTLARAFGRGQGRRRRQAVLERRRGCGPLSDLHRQFIRRTGPLYGDRGRETSFLHWRGSNGEQPPIRDRSGMSRTCSN